ncbi:MAG: glycosyltransferase [Patescibacteria group bacterium]
MKKVLIISYFFPPLGGGGVIRMTKFVKYMPKFGFEPVVISPQKGFYSVKDPTLLNDIPNVVKIFRIKYPEPGLWLKWRWWQSFWANLISRLLIPDAQALWIIPAVIIGRRLIKTHKIKLIFTSSRSYSDHVAALILKKLTGVKWAADFRDLWTSGGFLKRQILASADLVTAVSEGLTEKLKKSAKQNQEKFVTLTNGFDEDDFIKAENIKVKTNKFNLKLKIVHIGSFYGLRQPKAFLQAFQELNLKDIEFDFIGGKKRVSHHQAIREMMRADVLLLILSPKDGPEVMTGKIFEYLAARKPILALAPKNSGAARLLSKLKVGEVAPPDDVEKIKQKLKKIYQKSRKSGYSIPRVNLEPYTRQNLTQKLAENFQKILQKNHKIKLCFIGNLQAPQNQSLVNFLRRRPFEIYFLTTHRAKIPGIRTIFIGRETFLEKLPIWYFGKTQIKIRKIIRQISPDILHGQDLVFAGIWAALSGFQPLILTCWGSDVFRFGEFIWPEKKLIRFALNYAEIVTGTSESIGDQAVKIGLAREKFQLVHFGVDLSIFRRKKSYYLSHFLKSHPKKKIIFCPRSIAPIYNIDILIEAFYKITKVLPVKLVLLDQNADIKYFRKITQKIHDLKLNEEIAILPKVKNPQMAAFYNAAEVVISLPSSDSSSVSFLEAMACERKIIITDLPYTKEWLAGPSGQKTHNFWQVPVRNVEATYQALKAALNFPEEKWQSIGSFNRQLVAQKAEKKSNFEKMAKLYQDLCR